MRLDFAMLLGIEIGIIERISNGKRIALLTTFMLRGASLTNQNHLVTQAVTCLP